MLWQDRNACRAEDVRHGIAKAVVAASNEPERKHVTACTPQGSALMPQSGQVYDVKIVTSHPQVAGSVLGGRHC